MDTAAADGGLGQTIHPNCALHTLIHTFAVWIYLPYIVATELEIALHPP